MNIVQDNIKHAESLARLIQHAQRDSGQSRRIANFLLAWWNADECGGFDLTDLWGVDKAIAADMVVVFQYVAGQQRYPDNLGFAEEFDALVRQWRPALAQGQP